MNNCNAKGKLEGRVVYFYFTSGRGPPCGLRRMRRVNCGENK